MGCKDGCCEGFPVGTEVEKFVGDLDGVNEIFAGRYIGNAFLVGLLLGRHDGSPSGATLGRREGVRLGLLLGC